MEHNPGADWLTEAAKAAEQQGPGNLLRIVLIVMVVGCVLVGWFLLRGYRKGASEDASGDVRKGADEGAGRSADEGADKGADHRNG
ncbi:MULTISPECIES: hypothetical protein [Streptomyces]|uniref:Uncharacterized protein n=1 Tax=Streptomyces venezuelae TaxID=54571 RepID=A0A5P2BBI2_STRVZ|nr:MULTISPECIES: hypothetical protein [Streptomyces]NEA04701.1 hypothetical protein [Streptomyces sp. SID10116]MYY79928.1 hypothetical protein [Streptomyces sp. SID335]MYZ15344.1 hypothetical protein [Streptomyces sp. SID337]NDZ86267.1 hypothetical protein [Streptomyces sp. SID10115]NEB48570.1 hypothetical protein [Streptomyces sp. SID339]